MDALPRTVAGVAMTMISSNPRLSLKGEPSLSSGLLNGQCRVFRTYADALAFRAQNPLPEVFEGDGGPVVGTGYPEVAYGFCMEASIFDLLAVYGGGPSLLLPMIPMTVDRAKACNRSLRECRAWAASERPPLRFMSDTSEAQHQARCRLVAKWRQVWRDLPEDEKCPDVSHINIAQSA